MASEFNEHDDGLKVDSSTFHDVPVEERRHVTELDVTNEDEDIRPVNDTPQHVITVSIIFWLLQVMGEILFIVGMGVIDKRWVMYFMPFLWAYIVSGYLLVHSVGSPEPRVNALYVAIYVLELIVGLCFVVAYADLIHVHCTKNKDDTICQGYLTAQFGWIVIFVALFIQGWLLRREFKIRNARTIKYSKSIYARGLRMAIWTSVVLYVVTMIISFPIAYGSNDGGSFFFSLALFFMFSTSWLLGLEKPIEERHRALVIFHVVIGIFGMIAYYIGTYYMQTKYD
mmetsp:Transcript_14206/g.19798  ORF Transcript_14206/g.19798 Transcript_14206/m.19798 type:complete len:284 (-) Transcript_14206:747-1598(-)|eukprot:CAMPEP_0168565618 /NCGR_PEP_ID=MMETSP0413-20121227/13947_1 /TAXON_ID=136452 /ORGANISM="Filamoeba nolandi, Strain NC-AS-23-1" /LENGTH=283 /DNA_ID=CAMNT_0008597513 /DNA_START=34 /DNA_END=885 /DNA_ORIENTATION=-